MKKRFVAAAALMAASGSQAANASTRAAGIDSASKLFKKADIKARGAAQTAPAKRLAAFFRNLASTPDRLEKFFEGGAARAAIISNSGLSDEHKSLLRAGCNRDIAAALASTGVGENTTISIPPDAIEGSQLCGHADCQSFRTASKNA